MNKMCEQTPLHYKHGDIVWVKMGICWWPGEVVEFEKLPDDIRSSFKKGTKLPLVTVTFFQEDNYEYIKNLSNIYVYNCSKKDDFIKKGMDLIRAKNAFMEKFPSDIRIAEEKTNGNVDILDDPKYGPDNKQEFFSVVSQVFGSPTKKRISLGKGKRKSSINSKTPTSTKKSSGHPERNVTHPRFLGISNDHKVHVLIQTGTQHTREARDEKIYYCQTCDFSSTRINVIVLHNQSHLQGNYMPTSSKKSTRAPNKKTPKKLFKIPLSKTSTIDEDLALLKSGIALSDAESDDSDDDEDKPKLKNKRKKKGAEKTQGKKSKVEQKVEKKDIRVDLLKEWDDDDEEEEAEASIAEEQSKTEPSSSKKDDSTCFDFNDDDEKEIITTATAGRKIPRVIPDKRKSTEPTEDANLPTAENDVNRTDQIEKNDATTEKPLDVDAFNDILEATKVPELPEVPQSLKCEQNFHSTRTIKFPDKPLDSPGPEVHIKKRFVKSFEDFEMSLKLIREKEELEKREKEDNESAIEDTNLIDEECLKHAINNGQEATNQSQSDEKHIDSSSELKVIETVEPETPKESKDEVSEENQSSNNSNKIKRNSRNLRGSQSKSTSKSPVRTEDEPKTTQKQHDSEKSLPETVEKPEDTIITSKSNDKDSKIEEQDDKSISSATTKTEISDIDKNLESEKQEPEINTSKTEEIPQLLKTTTDPEEKHDSEEKLCKPENVPLENIKKETRRSRRSKSSSIEKVEVEIKVDEHKDSISIEAVTLPVEEKNDPEITTSVLTKTSNDFEDDQVSKEKPCDSKQEPAVEQVKSPLIEEPVEKKDDLEKISKKSHERTNRRKKSTDKYDSFEERFSKRHKSAIERLHDNEEVKKKLRTFDLFEAKPSKSKQHINLDEPTKSKKPDSFEQSSRSKKHDSLDEPSNSKKHENFEEQSKSKKQENLDEPLKSKKHEKLEEPSKSKKRDNSDEPSKSKKKDNSVEPSKDKKHSNFDEPSISKKDENSEEPSKSKKHEPTKSKKYDNLFEPSEAVKHDDLDELTKSKKDEHLEQSSKSKKHDNLDDKTSKPDESKRRKLKEFDFERSYKSRSKTPHKDEEKKTEIEHSSKKALSRMHSSEDLQNKKLKTHEEDTENYSKYESRRDKYYKSSKKLRPHKQEVTVANVEAEVETKVATDEENKETKSGLKVSQLKSQLMNKLNEPEAEPEPAPRTRTRSHSKTELDVTDDTENKHPSKRPRRFSLHTEEIIIEKSVDKVEVTIHKEETESQNAEAVEEKPKEAMEIEVELSLPEKQVHFEQVEAEVTSNQQIEIENDIQNETIVETVESTEIKVPEVIEQIPANIEEVIESKLEESIEIPEPDTDNKLPETEPSYDEIAAINTLASISEMRNFGMVPSEHEINIDKNVTVVSESDLADGQVEIAKMPIIEEGTVKATTTITSFSVDFTGEMDMPKSEETAEKVCVIIPEKPQAKIEEKSVPEETIPKEVEPEKPESVPEVTVEMEMAKLTDTNIETTVAPQPQEATTSTKLLEILTDAKVRRSQQEQALKIAPRIQPNLKISNPKFNLETKEQIVKPKAKVLIRSAIPGTSKTIRPVIVSEKKLNSSSKDGNSIALPKVSPKDPESTNLVSVQKVCSKRSDDIEDIDTFIIKKPLSSKKSDDEEVEPPKMLKKIIKPPKTKILEHAILKPAKEVQATPLKTDDNVFDIDSMPIVLSDQILTPESLENMPIMIQQENAQNTPKPVAQIRKIQPQQQMKLLNKSPSPIIKQTIRGIMPNKTPMKQIKTGQKVLTPTSTLIKHNPSIITQTSKGSKFLIMTSEVPSTPTVNKYTVGKRQFIKKSPAILTGSTNKVLQGVSQDASGNKIMIVTNNKGQQQQVVLTPTSQKMIPHSATKKIYKGTVQRDVTKSPNIISQTIINSKGQITTTNPSVFTSSSSISKKPRIEPTSKNKILGQKLVLQGNLNQIKSSSGQPRTIIIKNPQGQTVKKIQGTDDALLEKQVAEQLEAINRAASQQSQTMTFKSQTKRYSRKTLTESTKLALQNKAQMVLNTSPTLTKSAGSIPPLAPISPVKKTESQPPPSPTSKVSSAVSKPLPPKLPATTATSAKEVEKPAAEKAEPKRAPHQLVIQDALGNQTTIVEGQILALPSETVDGQPQSYMLVTVDETGNLTPLNNEALMSLDPNLVGDLGANMVLQVDQGAPSTETKETVVTPPPAKVEEVVPQVVETEVVPPPEPVQEEKLPPEPEIPDVIAQPAADASQMQTVSCAINNGESNQQLIITGDPIATQKFLESLTEGNADLANLLANAEGNILIHADGQQILINTDSDNQMLLTLNSESSMNSMEGGEGSGNPIFSSQAPKNQDILAAALADTDVFQAESSVVPSSKVPSSQLSPGGPLYPINVNNVLETSSMSSPIMTPLEVPSTNVKKIDDTDILSQIPKNVDLPITVTDPNIAQTVAHQQVALMSDELHTNLELPLAISDVAVTSAGMNSPSFGYSLPTLEDSVDMQKPFTSSISMPLLTEEPEDVVTTSSVSVSATLPSDIIEKPVETPEINDVPVSQDEDAKTKEELTKTESSSLIKQYLLATSGLSAINNQMCSSLSEPPPDMFDFTMDQSFEMKPMEKSVTSSTDEEYVSNIESEKSDEKVESEISTPNTSSEINSPSTTSTDSCEIPVQPDIVTDMKSAENSKDSEM